MMMTLRGAVYDFTVDPLPGELSGVAYTTSGFKARSNARWRGRSLAFKTRWRMCFSGFRTSRSPSFVFMKTFSLFFFFFLTDRTRTAGKVIYLLISVQFIFFHAL